VHLDGVQPAPTTLEYGAMFPWTHERNVFRGEGFIQTCVDDLPPNALVDRASAASIGVQAIISVPVRVGGQTTHVLSPGGSTSRSPPGSASAKPRSSSTAAR
jgi:hypothetical protein